MYALGKCPDYRSIIKCVRLYSLARKSHYDVLKLRKNCSDKEIKEAFIQMSKEYHPDKNKDAKAQENFVRIVEAYNVLGKPSSRAQYDNLTEISSHSHTYSNYSYVYRSSPYTCRNGDYNYYYENAKSKTYGQSNKNRSADDKASTSDYYGFAGIKKVPNYYIIGICFGIALFGVVLQVYVISELIRSSIEVQRFRNMYVSQRKQAQERSMKLADELERVRSAARDNGNELQTRLLLDKIVANANPTVATASLGQALAEDKKKRNVDNLLSEFGVGDSPNGWYDTEDVKGSWNDLKYIYETWCGDET